MRDELQSRVSADQWRKIMLGVAVLALMGLIHFTSPLRNDLWWQTFYNALHFPVFGLVSVSVLFITPPSWHWSKRLSVTLCSIVVLSILSEVAQIPLSNRSVSFGDLFNDWAGALAFLCVAFVLAPGFSIPAGRGRFLLIAALLLTIWSIKPLYVVSTAYWERYQQLPSIVPLHSSHSRMLYYLSNAHVLYRRSQPGDIFTTEVRFNDQGASSINFHDPWSDWRSYETLKLHIENLGREPFPLVIRIHDEQHLRGSQPHNDRFNRRLDITPGQNVIDIALDVIHSAPADRKMDLGRIDGIVIFESSNNAGRQFLLHDIRLE